MARAGSIIGTWDRYWTERGDGRGYVVFRLLWTSAQAYFLLQTAVQLSWDGAAPTLPYPFFPWPALLPAGAAWALCAAFGVSVLCVAAGWHTRVAQGVAAGCALLLFFRSAAFYHHHLALFVVVNGLIAFASTERFFSLDARRRARRMAPGDFAAWRDEPVSLLPARLILLQASSLYAFSALAKLQPQWFYRWSATTEALQFLRPGWPAAAWTALLHRDLAWAPIAFVIAAMAAMVPGVFLCRRRPVFLVPGLLLHWGFAEAFADPALGGFACIMICILFLGLLPLRVSGNPRD